jgi:hypothetical protein
MALRCSREHVSQKTRSRPFSTAVVQVRGTESLGAVLPQKSHVTGTVMRPAYADEATGPRQPMSCRGPVVSGAVCWLESGDARRQQASMVGNRRLYSERARARRACAAARSARRDSRRAIASCRPRRMSCASPRRADICARARSSFIKFIFLLRFVSSFMSSGVPFLRAGADGSVTASGRARGGPGGRLAPRDATCAGRGRGSGRGEVARPPPDARGAATERWFRGRTWHSPLSSLLLWLVRAVCCVSC